MADSQGKGQKMQRKFYWFYVYRSYHLIDLDGISQIHLHNMVCPCQKCLKSSKMICWKMQGILRNIHLGFAFVLIYCVFIFVDFTYILQD